MRKILAAAAATAAIAAAVAPGALAAPNPSGTGLPSQSCQDILTAGGSLPSTQSGTSPGSPFNEPGFGSTAGGIGGQNYNETSQYDVACYQVTASR
jgi:hypothetical protein